jgi:hypothetical protein
VCENSRVEAILVMVHLFSSDFLSPFRLELCLEVVISD